MQSENVYIGDDKFQRFLDHYACPAPLDVVKMRFAGAVCSPNTSLRPTDVITSLFGEQKQPRLETKNEAELFFKFFMGLWDEMFLQVKINKLKLSPLGKTDCDNLEALCHKRAEEVEQGFVEGFWGGAENLSIPNYAAELIASLSDMADVYEMLAKKLRHAENSDDIYQVVRNTDKMVEKTLSFLIEHLVLPNIAKIQRSVN